MQTATVLHIGDCHILQALRRDERLRAIGHILGLVEDLRPNLVAIPGDLYEGPVSVADEREAQAFLVGLAGACPVVVSSGNHDPRGEVAKLERLRTGLDDVSHRHPVLATETPRTWDVAGFRVAALSHSTKAIATANLPPGATIEDGDDLAMAFARRTLGRFGEDLGAFPGPTLLLAHVDVAGAVASNGETRRDAALALTVEDLLRVGASAVLLNHVHREQTMAWSESGGERVGSIWYAGSIFQTDFGERSDRKAVVSATFDVATGHLVERVFHQLPQRPMAKIEVQLGDEGWQTVEKHRPIPGEHVWPELPADAEVWVVLHYPSDRAAEYRTMRDEAARRYPGARIEGCGIPVVERRSIEFSSAKGLVEAFESWRRSEGDYAPLASGLVVKLEQTEAAVSGFGKHGGPSAAAGDGLALGDLEYQGINSVGSPVKIPYGQMRGIICFAGPNGSGKTTTFEASLAALTREMAYYGKSVSARARGAAYIAQSFRMAGHDYQSTIRISAKGAVEAWLVRDGLPLNDPKKLTEFDAAIREVVGTRELLELTVFARQADSPEGKQGFFNISPADRTERIMALTGNERYAKASEFARARKAALAVPIGEARSKVDGIERQLVALDDLTARAGDAEGRLAAASAAVAEADRTERAAIHVEAEIKALPEGAGAARRELDGKNGERERLRAAWAEKNEALGREQKQASRRADVEAAIARTSALAGERESSTVRLAVEERNLEALGDRQRAAAEIEAAIATKQRRIAELRHLVERQRQEDLAGLIEARNLATADVRQAEAALAHAQGQGQVDTAAARLAMANQALQAANARLRDAREQAAVKTPFGEKCIEAGCEFTGRARRARDEIPALESEVVTRTGEGIAAAATLEAAKAARAQAIADADASLGTARDRLEGARERLALAEEEPVAEPDEARDLAGEIRTLEEKIRAARVDPAEINAAKARLASLRQDLERIGKDIEEARNLATQLPLIEAAEQRAAELAAELTQITEQGQALKAICEELQRRLDGLAEHERLMAEAHAATDKAKADRLAAEKAHGEIRDGLSALRGQIAQLEALRPELDQMRQELERLSRDDAEWALVDRGCGKHGLQALAVDEAGPEIADLTNQILHQCHGTRWTFGITTQVEKADGKGVKNRFEPIVYDRGEPRDRVSGGEGAILDVAVRLALAIYNGRHSGKYYQVVWLDEAAQAVGVEHAATYIKMLRLAQDLGGFLQIGIISHVPAILALVDWVVRFKAAATPDGVPPGEIESIECLTARKAETPAREAVAA